MFSLSFTRPLCLVVCLLLSACQSQENESYPGGRRESTELRPTVAQLDGRAVEYVLSKNGQDTVVFEHGLAGNVYRWDLVLSEIAKDTTAFAYSRAGNGLSERSDTPRDGEHAVEELRRVLRQQGLNPPYVLVGHSLGGLYMQWYARRYPDEVRALVLVDSIYPSVQQLLETKPPLWVRSARAMIQMKLLTPPTRVLREIEQVTATARAVENLPANPAIPVIALRAKKTAFWIPDDADGYVKELYPQAQERWINAGHDLQWEAPDEVVAAIRQALAASQRGTASRLNG